MGHFVIIGDYDHISTKISGNYHVAMTMDISWLLAKDWSVVPHGMDIEIMVACIIGSLFGSRPFFSAIVYSIQTHATFKRWSGGSL